MGRIRESAVPFIAAGAIVGGAAGGVLGEVIDRAAAEGIHRDRMYEVPGGRDNITLDIAEHQLDLAEAAFEGIQIQADDAVRELLDETCYVAVEPYRFGGEFGDVTETDAVFDLVNEPTLPCQPDPSQLRAIVRYVRAADEPVAEQWEDVSEWRAIVEEFEGYAANDENYPAGRYFAVAGAGSGAWFGFSALMLFRARRAQQAKRAEAPTRLSES